MKITHFLESLSGGMIIALAILLVFLIGLADYHAGPELSSSIFYVVPLAISAWYGSRKSAILIAILAAAVWLASDSLSGQTYSRPFIIYWNGSVRLGLFLIIGFLLSGYRAKLTVEETLADTDSLTGAYSRRAFYEKIDREIYRLDRFKHPFTLAYIDLDNFKPVNDAMGHHVGDELLKKVVLLLQAKTRKVDVVARLGGDEFALLMVETEFNAAADAMEKLRGNLLDAMEQEGWPVTFSIGLVSCERPPRDIQEVMRFADGLMYSVKKSGKNRIAHAKLE